LKYIPADSGKWKLDKQPLKRVLPFYSAESVVNTFEFLKKNYPQYLFYDNYNNIVFSAVPYFYIKNYYSSQDKLKEIFSLSKLDALQDKLKDFVSVLSELSGVVMDAFGVTGSILLDIHNPEFSDLGKNSFEEVKMPHVETWGASLSLNFLQEFPCPFIGWINFQDFSQLITGFFQFTHIHIEHAQV